MIDKQIVSCLKQVEKDVYCHLDLFNQDIDLNMNLAKKLSDLTFKMLTNLYSSENQDKSLIILDFIKNLDFNFEDNKINKHFKNQSEYLFYISLIEKMPQCLNKFCYLSHKYKICNDKYVVDFALLDRETNNPVIAIRLDEYNKNINQVEVSTSNKIDR